MLRHKVASYIIFTFYLPSIFGQLYSWSDIWGGHHQGHSHGHHGQEKASFINEWTVDVPGGEEVAELLALELGYHFGGEVLGFPGTYVFYKPEHAVSRRTPFTPSLAHDRRVSVLGPVEPWYLGAPVHVAWRETQIRWADQMFSKSRVKRYPTKRNPEKILHRVKRVKDGNNTESDQDGNRSKREVYSEMLFNDELWSDEWYLQDTRIRADLPRLDLNVLPVYAMGINGSGVRVAVLDDGVEYNHTDLRDNYDPEISWDCNDHDPDPTPRYDEKKSNSHGTRCAGEIAMIANNRKCGVGVAYGAKVGGIRLLDGQITDRVEGEAIGFAWDKVDIYSASWGPDDDGTTVEGPGRLANEAFIRGVEKGRNGKGVIYVWANGNGGGNRDNCNCDGYSSSIYTISIASASQRGLFPWYGEICSSTLATAYSSGAYKEQKIATTDIGDSCTLRHTGTSAAAPLAAGILALVLSANSNLTWRDVQHLIVWTSEYAPLSNNPGWQINGAGFWFDVRFGFGLLNAASLVTSAFDWKTVPEKTVCRVEQKPFKETADLQSGKVIEISFSVENCEVNYLEHVELILNARYTRRGALQVVLTSPLGTRVPLLSRRPKDISDAGFTNWPLTSVATWGEPSQGIWLASIADETDEKNFGKLGRMTLFIHGTKQTPEHMKNGPRNYNNDYNTVVETEYYKNLVDAVDKVSNNQAQAVPGSHEHEEDFSKYPTLLAEMEKELLRIHHRNSKFVDSETTWGPSLVIKIRLNRIAIASLSRPSLLMND